MKIQIAKEGTSYAIHVVGPLTLRVDEKIIRDALDAAMRIRYSGGDSVSKFWEVLGCGIGEAMTETRQICDNPLVQYVLSQCPVGGSMPTIQAADMACSLAERAISKRAKTFSVIHAAACGNPDAMRAIASVKRAAKSSPAAAARLKEIIQLTQLAADHEMLHSFMMNSAEIPPSYALVYE